MAVVQKGGRLEKGMPVFSNLTDEDLLTLQHHKKVRQPTDSRSMRQFFRLLKTLEVSRCLYVKLSYKMADYVFSN